MEGPCFCLFIFLHELSVLMPAFIGSYYILIHRSLRCFFPPNYREKLKFISPPSWLAFLLFVFKVLQGYSWLVYISALHALALLGEELLGLQNTFEGGEWRATFSSGSSFPWVVRSQLRIILVHNRCSAWRQFTI
ncbi:hypothetical protein BDZ91DRAFT_426916 [Kalaharituber pfeilii]|nr:hypothetical protein BDZ91DRAFT_426916 [Kalaharituber pfeilii]